MDTPLLEAQPARVSRQVMRAELRKKAAEKYVQYKAVTGHNPSRRERRAAERAAAVVMQGRAKVVVEQPKSTVDTVKQQIASVKEVLDRRRKECEAAYEAGQLAKKRGFMRVSPYYGDSSADQSFLAGYDGISFEEVAIGLNL